MLLRVFLSLICLFTFTTQIIAGSFEDAVTGGTSFGQSMGGAYHPDNINQTLTDKGVISGGQTSIDVTPRIDDAQAQQGNYSGFYSDPGGMDVGDVTDPDSLIINNYTQSGDFINNSTAYDLSSDGTWASKCLLKDGEGKCILWSSSMQGARNALEAGYDGCTEVKTPIMADEPVPTTCITEDELVEHQCVLQMGDLSTVSENQSVPCSELTITPVPGQIYAMCKDVYSYSKKYRLTSRDQVCSCTEPSCNEACDGLTCRHYPWGVPASAVVVGSQPAGSSVLGWDRENVRDCNKQSGWDTATYDVYDYYDKFDHSVVERVIMQQSASCGMSNYQEWSETCTLKDLEQCDPDGTNCVTVIEDGEETGNTYTEAPITQAGEFLNYTLNMFGEGMNFADTIQTRDLTSIIEEYARTTSEYFTIMIGWKHWYGGPGVATGISGAYSRMTFACNEISDSCQTLIDNGCVFYSRECIDDECNQTEYTYNCGGPGGITGYEVSYDCVGNVRCVGTECKDAGYDANRDLAKAATMGELMQQIKADSTFSDPANIEIFPGKEATCAYSPKNCCKMGQTGVNIGEMVVAGWEVSKLYASTELFIEGGWDAVINGTVELLYDVFNFAEISLDMAMYASEIATCFTIVSIAFTVYSVGKFLYDFLYKCTESDAKTTSKVDMRLCHDVGTRCASRKFNICIKHERVFCCFNSILARIVHEQGRPQIFGSNPWGQGCRGFTPDEMSAIDFGQINLTEYMQYLSHKLALEDGEQSDIKDSVKQKLLDLEP